jgi:putative Holliday junction resolvase
MMRCLALDVGDERIGVAVSDAGGQVARPLETLRRQRGPGSYLRLKQIIREYDVERVVVGWPLLPDGSEGKQVASTRAYVRGLEAHIAMPIVLWDERESTNMAQDILALSDRGLKRRRADVDAVAAAVILQDYLDQHPGGDRDG